MEMTFQRGILIDAKDSTANPSATLKVDDDSKIKVVNLDGKDINSDTPHSHCLVYIRMPPTTSSKNLRLTFALPTNATEATYKVGTGAARDMDGKNTATPSFIVIADDTDGTMDDKVVSCHMKWPDSSIGVNKSVTITVRPRASIGSTPADYTSV